MTSKDLWAVVLPDGKAVEVFHTKESAEKAFGEDAAAGRCAIIKYTPATNQET